VQRNKGTDGSLLASLPWSMAALGFAVIPHVPYMPSWITAALLICAGGRLYIERRRKRLPPAWVRIVLALICFIGVLATYQNITGVGPGSALLVIMAALKLLETRQRRDQFVLLFISIFLIMSSLLREQYLWSLPYLVLGVMVTMTAWLRMSAGENTAVRQNVGSAARLLLYAAPLAVAMWVFFPRLSNPFWAIPVDSSRAKTGLSDTMSPGDISSLSLSNKVAFRVDFETEVPQPQQLYWRGLVLHHFNGRTWTGNEPSMVDRAKWPIEYFGDPVRYQITLEPTSQHWVYALDVPFEWTLDKTVMGNQQQLLRRQPIEQRTSFNAVSYPQYALDLARKARKNDYYTRLPYSSNSKTRELARQMRATAGSNERYIQNVLQMFHEQEFYYTLEPPALGSNPVDRFLFDTRQGFCEHYASAFAVMMRNAAIPSRIVLGYQGGELNPLGGYLIVRQSDAHAWTEVWLDGRGWARIDPTAAVAPERISSGIAGVLFSDIGASWGLTAPSLLLHRLSLTWDALNARWNEWILGYGPENQNQFMKWLGMDDPNWRQMMLTLLAIVTAMIAAISMLLVIRYRPPKKDEAALLYAKFATRVGISPVIGETPQAYAIRICDRQNGIAEITDKITTQYLQTRYGPPNPAMVQHLRNSIKQFSPGRHSTE
jgi:transglutaminase-like putative cysteine protease